MFTMGVALLRAYESPLCLCWPKQSNANFSTRWPLKVSADVMNSPRGVSRRFLRFVTGAMSVVGLHLLRVFVQSNAYSFSCPIVFQMTR